MELTPPLHLPSDHQISDVEILEALPLLLSARLDVGDGGAGREDISPLVGILLMIEGERLIPVFQGRTRSASGARRLDSSTKGWDTPEGMPLEVGRRLYSPQMALRQSEEDALRDMLIVWWMAVLVGVVGWWNDEDLPTNEQSLYVPHFGATILHHSHHAHNPSPPTPISTAPICAHVHSMALINPRLLFQIHQSSP